MATAEFSLTWDLDSLLPNPESDKFAQIISQYETDRRELANRSEQLPPPDPQPEVVERWSRFIEDFGSLQARGSDLNAFIGCHAAADAANKTYERFEARLAALRPLREQAAANLELALRDLDDESFERFAAAGPVLQTHRFFLNECRRNGRLRLPKDQELLAAELGVDGLHAWSRLYDRISGELRIPVMQRGEVVRKSPGQVSFDMPDRSERENNFYAAAKAWGTIADTCADALTHIAGSRLTVYRRLGCTDHLDAPLRLNRLQRGTLETMWQVVTERKLILLKYFAKKAALLGLERLTWYDVNAPLPLRHTVKELSWDQACGTVLETFGEFSGDLGEFARRALDERWIEAEDRPNKRQGGFCTELPTKKQSRIFMTFTGSPNSMSTLAHELGHAYHSYVLQDQPVLLQDYPMNLAETASTFAEAILGDRRLAEAQSADEQLGILDNMLDDSVAFLMNIHCRYIFENNFHVERRRDELSAERLSELMLEAQQQAYCNGLAEEGYYPGFWISKLHFYIGGWPFYNFPYTFGYLLSQGIYNLARRDGEEFPEKYRQLLIATGCHETEEAVATSLGYDLTKPDFWHTSLDAVEERVEKFVKLADTIV